VPTVLEVSSVLEAPGTAASDLGLDWLRQLRSQGASDLGPTAPAGEATSRENAVPRPAAVPEPAIVPEPAMMALFGIGVLALVGRFRYKRHRARS
jgi:hypothetical protein